MAKISNEEIKSFIINDLKSRRISPEQFSEEYAALFFVFYRRHFDYTDAEDQVQWEQAFNAIWGSAAEK